MIAEDAEVMDEVLKTFENLQNVTKTIIKFFAMFAEPSLHQSVEQRFIADTCGELNAAFSQAMSMVC